MAGGPLHTLFLTPNGVYAAGSNASRQLGRLSLDGGKGTSPKPLLVPSLELTDQGSAGASGGVGGVGGAGGSGAGSSGAGGSIALPVAPYEAGEELPGGALTRPERDGDAFARRAPTLTPAETTQFIVGEAAFQIAWVEAPASATLADRDGVGPLFHAVSCLGCHFQNGRGAPPPVETDAFTLLVRLSRPGTSPTGGPLSDPVYGDQIQPRGLGGVAPEARVRVAWAEVPGVFADKSPYSLAKPTLLLDQLGYGPLPPEALLSPRIAPPVFGLGLLEAIPEAAIVALADPDDLDGDGISGRPNRVFDVVSGATRLGRFGWKANQPSLHQQNMAAFSGDLGLTTPLFPGPSCTSSQVVCLASPSGGAPEVDDARAVATTAYTRFLAVPARVGAAEPGVLMGKQLFHSLGCASCHAPRFLTGDTDGPSLAQQTIFPYTDLLLHDLGPGLADDRPDFLATGNEWRTPPLWGIGLTALVSGHTRFLHDGRARSVSEAILWHGGEAEKAREGFRALTADEREALLAFVNSL
jgi:CxxC motif-containing protein (DUF1111 family)